ncbi:hypothetical protein J3R83DRAFT_5052 [Lanmaoa asiatica]|nr:hypothetical protein J3R83DRAFT_5052 [Lanmaoa asiatica]
MSAQLQGYRSAQWTGAGFSFVAALLAAIFLRKVGIVGHRRHTEEDSSEQTTGMTSGQPRIACLTFKIAYK